MKRRFGARSLLIPTILFAIASTVGARELKRFEIQPLAGFAASGGIPLISDDDVDHGSIRVDSSYSLGGTFAINLNEADAIEAFWQRQFTEGRLPGGITDPLSPGNLPGFNLKVDQIHCNFLHHYRITEPRALPYVMAGLGATTYRADRAGHEGSRSYFSFSLGGGVKYFFTPHFGVRGEARWSPTVITADDSEFWCDIGGVSPGATCVINLKAAVQHQVDLTGGLVFRF